MRRAARRFGLALLARLAGAAAGRFTPAGQLALAALAGAALWGVDTNQSMAYQAFTFLAALFLLASASAWGFRARLRARRLLPRCATAGTPLVYRVRVEEAAGRRRRGLTLLDGVAGAAAVEAPLPDLAPGGAAEVSLSLTPARRGRLSLGPLWAARPDLLGLVRARETVAGAESVLVLPRRYPVPALALPGSRRLQPGGVALASSVGESQEFVSLRDYRPGDPPRHIHWRSWAKAGRPIVKEHQDEYFVRHALALDTSAPAGEAFEEAVSVAASFACAVDTQEALLDLLFVADRAFCFTAGRGLNSAQGMLEVLAGAPARPDRPFSELARGLERRLGTLSGCILVLQGWDEERRALARGLRARGLPALVLLVAAGPRPEAEAEGVRVLEPGRAARGLAGLAA